MTKIPLKKAADTGRICDSAVLRKGLYGFDGKAAGL